MKEATRTYRMTSRARAVEETRERVLEAAIDLHTERLSSDISLADIAGAAGVSVQTLLRHFGSREALLEAVAALEDHPHRGVAYDGVHPAECRSASAPYRRTTRFRWPPVHLVRMERRGGSRPAGGRCHRPGHPCTPRDDGAAPS